MSFSFPFLSLFLSGCFSFLKFGKSGDNADAKLYIIPVQEMAKNAKNFFGVDSNYGTVFITTPSLFLFRLAVKQSSKITPWLFPFIMCDRFVLMCVMLAVIMIFSDVPIYDDTLNYILMRIGRKSWILVV